MSKGATTSDSDSDIPDFVYGDEGDEEEDGNEGDEGDGDTVEGLPTFDIDLDLPPLQRWEGVAKAYKDEFLALLCHNAETISHLGSMSWLGSLSKYALPQNQRDEVQALSQLLEAPAGMLELVQLVYEVFSLTDILEGSCGCTASVKGFPDGVVHARTLDWSWLHGLEQLLVNLRVCRSGEVLYMCTSFVGYVGVLTGMRFQKGTKLDHDAGVIGKVGAVNYGDSTSKDTGFSLSLNYRRPFPGAWKGQEATLSVPPLWRNWTLASALRHSLQGGWPVSSFLRHLLETCVSYDEAVNAVRGARLLAPCYITLAGTRPVEGAVFTRDCGIGGHEQCLSSSPVLAVSNMDPHGGEFPPRRVVGLDHCTALGPIGAKDVMQGESLLRRDMVLRIMGQEGDDETESTVETGITDYFGLLETVPIASEVTMHMTVMCPVIGTYITTPSSGLQVLSENGYFKQEDSFPAMGTCHTCCFYQCKKKAACANRALLKKHDLRLGSLLRRRGGAYYCMEHLPLQEQHLSTCD